MTSAQIIDIQAALFEKVGAYPAVSLKDGAAVEISYNGVTATGVLGTRAYGYHTEKGRNTLPVILDGTGQKIEVHAQYVKERTA